MSSPETTDTRDTTANVNTAPIGEMPPALSSMWRLCKLGYRHEPRLMLTAFILSQLAALPDALIALWLMLLGQGVHRTAARARPDRRDRHRRVRHRHVVPRHRQHPHAAAVPRSRDDRARIARRTPAGLDRDDRASRAARISRSPVDAAQSGVRARSHVHVAVLHLRVDSAARRHRRAPLLRSPRARARRRPRDPDRDDLHVAARRRTRRARTRRAADAARPSPLHDGDHRAPRQGSARHRHRLPPDVAAARSVRTRLRARRRSALGLRALAHARLGDLRHRLCRRDRLRLVLPRGAGRRCAAGRGGGLAAVRLHRRDGRRGRVPARLLDGWLAAARVARRLRGVAQRDGGHGRRPRGCGTASAWIACRSPIRARRASCSTT